MQESECPLLKQSVKGGNRVDNTLELQVHEALKGVAQALSADGYRLDCQLEGDALTARVVATLDACEDCLSPKGVTAQIISVALDEANLSVAGVKVIYPGEEQASERPATDSDLTAPRHRLHDLADAIEFCYDQGWTDGLPVIPPTPGRVAAMLAASGLAAGDVLGRIPERRITLRAEQVAINAVMAGCLPAYMPVVVAAVRGLLDPAFGLHGPGASTAGVGFLTVVNGPMARAIGLNSGENLFGPGNRANATIGRALRLLLTNASGPLFDRATLGHAGKYTYCMAEQEDVGWEPLHTMRGLAPGTSAVTVMAAEAPNQVNNHTAAGGRELLMTFIRRMTVVGTFNTVSVGGKPHQAVVICPEHRKKLQAEGWSKADVRQFLWENARLSVADLKRGGLLSGPVTPADEEHTSPVTPTVEDLLILTAGGEAGGFSAVIPGWGTTQSCRAVTVPISQREG
jgi:hypothetical protein